MLIKLFVVSTQADYTPNTLAKEGYWLRLLNCPLYLLFSRFEHCLKTQFSAVFARLLISWGWKTLFTEDEAMSWLLCLSGRGTGHSRSL